MSFTPATDDVKVFLRDLQECAKQLNYDDQVVITTIRAAMPQEVYGALYKMEELSEVIDFCKNYYAKSPKERLKAQSTAKLDASPFKNIQEESPPDITTTLNKLTESLSITLNIHWMEKLENGMQIMLDKQTSSLHGKPS